MNRRLLALYPRHWRERYGAEVIELSDELVRAGETTPRRAALDLVRGALVERTRPLFVVGLVVVMFGAGAVDTGRPRPYFVTHRVGLLLLVAESVWLTVELAEWRRGRRLRNGRADQRRFTRLAGACAIAATLANYLGPALFPDAGIRPGGAAFTAGVVVLTAGIALRGWSFAALRGRYLNFSVVVHDEHPVLTAGPYRLLRHPGHAGMLLICAGFGLASANWTGLAGMTLLPLAVIVPRIRDEERALLASAGDRYRRYARDHKRLVPLIW
jgi:protein-S-isoprenylcysteine O-methyltransferase Ste14